MVQDGDSDSLMRLSNEAGSCCHPVGDKSQTYFEISKLLYGLITHEIKSISDNLNEI